MQDKHFFTDPTHLVNTALHALTLTNPSLAHDKANKIIYRRPTFLSENPKVSIITGGGSGHEPAFAGFVGRGLITASVAGTIFASPSAEQVRRAVMHYVPHEAGVLVITMNYTGDVLNFGMAAEKARSEGVNVGFFAIGDDVGVGREKGGKVGRRGIGGGVLVLKIVGALAEMGGTLEQVLQTAKLAVDNLVSLGSSLEHVHVVGRGAPDPESVLPRGEVEVGMGIHNEVGSHRVKADLPELVKIMLAQMLDQNDKDRSFADIKRGDEVIMLVNNLGGVSTLEISGILAEFVLQAERDYGVVPVRIISGTFLTSLNGLGFSVSFLKNVDTGLGDGKSFLDLIDAPAEAVGWAAPIKRSTWESQSEDSNDELTRKASAVAVEKGSNLRIEPTLSTKSLTSALKSLKSSESEITHYDTIVGDGDCGTGLKRGAEAILSHINALPSSELSPDAVIAVTQITSIVETNMDGTSGAIYAIFLNALASGLRSLDSPTTTETPMTVQKWSDALSSAMSSLSKYTPATIGDRTLLDALIPFVTELQQSRDLGTAVKAAADGAVATKGMRPGLGRTVYVGGEEEWMGKIPDPGAWGVKAFLEGMVKGFEE